MNASYCSLAPGLTSYTSQFPRHLIDITWKIMDFWNLKFRGSYAEMMAGLAIVNILSQCGEISITERQQTDKSFYIKYLVGPRTWYQPLARYSCNSPSRFRFGSKNLEERILGFDNYFKSHISRCWRYLHRVGGNFF